MPRMPGKRVPAAICAIAATAACALAPTAQAAPLRAPSLASPSDSAVFGAVPPFEWKKARRAEKYEFQLAADPKFESIVLGRNQGGFQTRNTFATIDKTLPNGDYYWRVRPITASDNAGRWSPTRTLRKRWTDQPKLLDPVRGEPIDYPTTPLVLRWQPVPRAYKYLLWIGTDPSLASTVKPIETSATVYSPPVLGPGRYFWAVTPIDAQKHAGTRSAVGSFDWRWPSRTETQVVDLNEEPRVIDPQFRWDPVAGAAAYEVEVNHSEDWAPGSKVCCTEEVIGTSLSPKKVLPNNAYYWRMRAVDLDGTAGAWNEGPRFVKTFDQVAPTIPSLRMHRHFADSPDGVGETSYPIVRWDPVPGAASYQVQVVPHDGVFCNWTIRESDQWNVRTAGTAWTPLASAWNRQAPVANRPEVALDPGTTRASLAPGASYCVRVLARSDRDSRGKEVVSEWTQIAGVGQPAFKYMSHTDNPGSSQDNFALAGPQFTIPGNAYGDPPHEALTTRLPLFTWRPVQGAGSYFVVVAKDPAFTQVLDVALTQLPMYAPRKTTAIQTYPDETTSYYWAVVPAGTANGDNAPSQPGQNSPRSFQKRSVPPVLASPAEGENVLRQPVFQWTPAEGARNYRVQVARDPSFSNLVDDVTTASISYTSEGTYPADVALYWRVRATDERDVGLSWSRTGSFRRRLPIPRLDPKNPRGGETIPALRWAPVEGATSYDLHVDQADGTRKDFHVRGTAFTAAGWYGTGIWRWQVRANFPSGSYKEVRGGYSSPQPFARHIATPATLRATNRDRHVLLSWAPAAMARNYRVEVSTTDSFTRLIDWAVTDHTAWAPKLTQQQMIAGGRFYWRVAAVDEGRNVGGWRVGKLRTSRGFLLRAGGFARKKVKSRVQVRVMNGAGNAVRKAKVIVSGAGAARKVRRTNRDGVAVFKVRPRRLGMIKFRVSKRGYRTGTATITVR